MAKRTASRRETRPRKPNFNLREPLAPRYGIALLLLCLTAFSTLVLSNILTTSATYDEPVHLLSAALRHRNNSPLASR